ncbi:transposable element-derived 1-like [Octopus vulgaris]|uniref:Transposable element-derived 1-like n=1 Tax=Octopus vulgaris TaxID=6645 RepID=A0AA36BIZ4_OCTVU|nr:transposable element-derived 1-like [Octopus vulgaris]
MDNAEGHALDLRYEGVQIEFLPPNTTSLIQPMDQDVIRAFKTLYTRNSLRHLVEAKDSDERFSLKEYWGRYSIATCLQNIQVIKEMKNETLNGSWKKLWPEAVHNYKGFSSDEIYHSAIHKAVKPEKLLGGDGFTNMTTKDFNNLIAAHSDPLTDEDLTGISKSASEDEEEQRESRGRRRSRPITRTLLNSSKNGNRTSENGGRLETPDDS